MSPTSLVDRVTFTLLDLIMKRLIALTLGCVALYTAQPARADDFSLQSFMNNNAMIDFLRNYQEVRLFVAEKSSQTPFTDFNVNEADQFFLGTYTHGVLFDRDYQITKNTPQRFLNFDIAPYDMGVYPIADAIDKTLAACPDLNQEKLTSFSLNHPAVQYDVIIYLFTTQDSNEKCTQTLFDTFHKTVTCKASSSSCYTK